MLKFKIIFPVNGYAALKREYPGLRGGIKEDKENFVKLVRSLRQRLSKRGKLITAAIGATSTYIREAYAPMRELCE